MRIRDGKLEGINPDGTLVHLTKEMIRIAKVNQIELQTQLYALKKQKEIRHTINFERTRSIDNLDSESNMINLSKSPKGLKRFTEKYLMSKRTGFDAFMKHNNNDFHSFNNDNNNNKKLGFILF